MHSLGTQIAPDCRGTSESGSQHGWSLVVAANDEAVLRHTLLASPVIDSNCQVVINRGYRNAGEAYSAGLAQAKNEIVVFAHQDVYLPADWMRSVRLSLDQLADHDPHWGALGVFGVSEGPRPANTGFCYSTGLRSIVGASFHRPIQAHSLDELVLIVRRSSGLAFDTTLPGFHLYGADICMQAESLGMKSYIIPAFCIHNSNGVRHFPADFWRAYLAMRRKWSARLPIRTCCTTITRLGFPAIKAMLCDLRDALLGSRQLGTRVDDPQSLYKNISGAHHRT